MDVPDECFVSKVVQPVKIVDVQTSQASPAVAPLGEEVRQHSFTTLDDLNDFFNAPTSDQFNCRYISICQRNSWSALHVTRPMLDLIVSKHEISDAFYQLPSCFYVRKLDYEGSYCVPYTQSGTGDWIETLYTIRYPEFKEGDDGEEGEWVIRQSGVYQRLNTTTLQNLIVLFSPNSKAAADIAIQDLLVNRRHELFNKGPLWLHHVLLSTYLPAWRRYIAAQERELLPIANTTFASYIDKPLNVGYDNLSTLVSLENRFLKILTLVSSTSDVLDELLALDGVIRASVTTTTLPPAEVFLRNYRRQSDGYVRTTTYLRDRTRCTAQLLADTLALRDQVIAKDQGATMLQLNKSAVFITMLTLIYLPPSLVASFFGMNFFDMDQKNSRIVGTSMVWIYIVASVVLMTVTFGSYYWLLQERDSSVFRHLSFKVPVTPDWREPFDGLKRRFSTRYSTAPPPGVELQGVSV